jgi:L-alanine-DL-glutamate epimerase-like enolase superfamily enzyme
VQLTSFIRRIEAFELAVPLPQPLQLGAITILQREYTVVRVHAENGKAGTAIGLTRNAPVAATVLRSVAPHYLGAAVDDCKKPYERALNANVCLGTNGIFWRALSLVDCALYDLVGQLADLPLGEVLGGEMRPVACIFVGGYPLPDETPASLRAEIRHMRDAGASAIKIGSFGNLVTDTERLFRCREEMPDGLPLMIDLYWQFQSAEELLKFAPQWSQFGIGWIEDPVRFDDYESAARLSEGLTYPVAIGDEQCGLLHFERLMDQGRIGVVRLDATACGGITGFLPIAAAAAQRGLPISCHIFPEMHAQLAALIPEIKWLELFPKENGLDSMHMLLRSEPHIENGCLVPSAYPGLGYEWDEEALIRFRVQ